MAEIAFTVTYCLALVVLGLFGLHKYYLLRELKKYKQQPQPLPEIPRVWPEVTVQLPVFNERYVLKRLIKAVANIDYPLDKLHVQLLDDSTDHSVELARRLCKVLQDKGFRIDHVRRPNRVGFKAGALAYGMQHSTADYFAVFDADFVPQPDFLKDTIPHLLQDGVGMVQARWGHLNRNYSVLTRLQAIFLDAHFLIEHLTRNRSGKFFNFNGTAGVWRRQAIEDAGGWQHDTLTEDLDLSYRAQLEGWRFVFLPDVVAPAELPAEMNGYKNQQHRWAKGSVQTALKLMKRLYEADLPRDVKIEAMIHLSNNFAWLLMGIPAILLVPMVKVHIAIGEIPWTLALIYIAVFLASTVSVLIYYSVAMKEAMGYFWKDVWLLPLLMALGIGMSLNNGRAAVEALIGHKSDFIRTPKFMLEGRKGNWRRKLYRPGHNWQQYIELLIASYFTYGWVYFMLQDIYYSVPFFMMFIFGFSYTALSSIYGQR